MRVLLITLAVIYCVGAGLVRSIIIEPNACPPASNIAAADPLGKETETGGFLQASEIDIKSPLVVKPADTPSKEEGFSWSRSILETGERLWGRQTACDEG